ncbi:hypothetical protein [Ilyobacter sp.]|uniref:hypothetical protein n=1 Tax=Ilyobacter sp. TaxID=3100343 RepID=UPI00356B3A74
MEELTIALKFHYASVAMSADNAFEKLENSPHSNRGNVEKQIINGKTYLTQKFD